MIVDDHIPKRPLISKAVHDSSFAAFEVPDHALDVDLNVSRVDGAVFAGMKLRGHWRKGIRCIFFECKL